MTGKHPGTSPPLFYHHHINARSRKSPSDRIKKGMDFQFLKLIKFDCSFNKINAGIEDLLMIMSLIDEAHIHQVCKLKQSIEKYFFVLVQVKTRGQVQSFKEQIESLVIRRQDYKQ